MCFHVLCRVCEDSVLCCTLQSDLFSVWQVEQTYPGFAYDFVKGLLLKAGLQGQIDMCESLLRLEGLNESDGKISLLQPLR